MPYDVKKLKALRAAKWLTQQELALQAGVPLETVAAIEHGETPTQALPAVRMIAVTLGVTSEDLLLPDAAGTPAATPPGRPAKAATTGVPTPGTVAAGPRDRSTVFDVPAAYAPATYPPGCVALVVTGRGCTRFGVCDEDTVIVRPTGDAPDGKLVVLRNADGYALAVARSGRLWQFTAEDPEPVEVKLPALPGTRIVGVVIDRHGEPFVEPGPLPQPRRKKPRTTPQPGGR